MAHVVLLGDSIFDNGAYVPGGPPVVRQLQQRLGSPWQATLLAVDGHVISDVARQLSHLPADASHLVVSAGGNDALQQSGILQEPARSAADVLLRLAAIQDRFRQEYVSMLEAVLEHDKPTVVCTIYDRVPFPDEPTRRVVFTALSVFNDCIIREAVAAGVVLLDLRLVCQDPGDYSSLSPIEPSVQGGGKIAESIAVILTRHNFALPGCTVYGRAD
jgi:hypothetical protein